MNRTRTDCTVWGLSEETEACCNCTHFCQHYILTPANPYYTPTYRGHGIHPRRKERKVCDVCEHFKRRESDKRV